MYIDDCLHGTQMIMDSDIEEPINLGSDELVTINQLVDIVEEIAGVRLKRRYNVSAPKGVNGRNSDNTMIIERLGWAPNVSLRIGLEKTYRWIFDQMAADFTADPDPDNRRRAGLASRHEEGLSAERKIKHLMRVKRTVGRQEFVEGPFFAQTLVRERIPIVEEDDALVDNRGGAESQRFPGRLIEIAIDHDDARSVNAQLGASLVGERLIEEPFDQRDTRPVDTLMVEHRARELECRLEGAGLPVPARVGSGDGGQPLEGIETDQPRLVSAERDQRAIHRRQRRAVVDAKFEIVSDLHTL